MITDGKDVNTHICVNQHYIKMLVDSDKSDDIFTKYRLINYLIILLKYKDINIIDSLLSYSNDYLKKLFYIVQPITDKLGFKFDDNLLLEDNIINLAAVINHYK